MKPTRKTSATDLYFMDARSKLIDIAAFMDRVEREGENDDFRYQAFLNALDALQNSPRAENVLRSLSDQSVELIPQATTKAACGACPPSADGTDA